MKHIQDLMTEHNRLVKETYKSTNINTFRNYILNEESFSDGYIEIPSNETLSGHAEILELE